MHSHSVSIQRALGGDNMNAFVGKKEMGKRLIALRGDIKLCVAAAGMGITSSALANYESGIRIPRDDVKAAIANYYKTTIQAIFFLE